MCESTIFSSSLTPRCHIWMAPPYVYAGTRPLSTAGGLWLFECSSSHSPFSLNRSKTAERGALMPSCTSCFASQQEGDGLDPQWCGLACSRRVCTVTAPQERQMLLVLLSSSLLAHIQTEVSCFCLQVSKTTQTDKRLVKYYRTLARQTLNRKVSTSVAYLYVCTGSMACC